MKLGQKTSLSCTLSKVGVKAEEHSIPALQSSELLFKVQGNEGLCPKCIIAIFSCCGQDLLMPLQDFLKILSFLVKPMGLELLFCLCKWACSGDNDF